MTFGTTLVVLDCYSVRLSIRLSVCPSASVSAAPSGLIGGKFYTGTFYEKSVKKFQILLEFLKNVGHFT
jgi:hypothetical protein